MQSNQHQITDSLFFDEKILEKYGLFVGDNKEEWLNSTIDNGELYYALENKLMKRSDIINVTKDIKNSEAWIIGFLKELLTEEDYLTLSEIIYYFNQDNSSRKTKIGKLSFNMMMGKAVTLSNKYNKGIDMFIYYKFNLKRSTILTISIVNSNFNTKLNEYKDLNAKLRSCNKFIENRIAYLDGQMKKYNSGTTNEFEKFIYNTKQDGKFIGSNWSTLKKEDKKERFESWVYSRYPYKPVEFTDKLIKFILDSYEQKTLKYNNIKWNKNKGIIYDIKNLQLEKEDSGESRNSDKCKKVSDITNSFSDFNITKAPKQIVFDSKIITQLDKVNEEVLYCLLIYMQLDECLIHLQNVFHVEKFTNIEKKKITSIYNDMDKIIKNNEYEED